MITGLVFSIFAIIVSIVGSIVDGIASAVFAAEKACVNTETFDTWGSDENVAEAGLCAIGWSSYTHKSGSSSVTAATFATSAEKGSLFYNYFYNNFYNNNFYYNHPYYNANNNFYYNHPYYNANNNANNNFYYNHPYYNANHNYNFYSYTYTYQCVCTDNSVCYGYNLASGNNCGSILTTYSSLLSASTALLSILVVVSFIYSIFTCIACGSTNVVTAPVTVQPVQQVQMVPQSAPAVFVQPGVQPVMYGSAVAPAPVGYMPQQQPVMYAPVGYAPVNSVVTNGDAKFV